MLLNKASTTRGFSAVDAPAGTRITCPCRQVLHHCTKPNVPGSIPMLTIGIKLRPNTFAEFEARRLELMAIDTCLDSAAESG